MNLNMQEKSARSLRRALVANAVFSGFSGLLILLAERQVVAWLGLEGLSIWPVGLMLVIFSASLAWMASRQTVAVASVRSVILSDWAWVAATATGLALAGRAFSLTGVLILVDIAVVVGLLAFLQQRGLAAARKPAKAV